MRGKKGERHADPLDPPRRRANKQRGHGTYDNDRPPIVGTVGRYSGQCRLRVRHHTDSKTLQQHVHGYTQQDTTCYTDEWQGYNRIKRTHHTVCHGQKEWARDDDGDGIREVHTNTIEGYFSILKRGIYGVYQHVSEHHLKRYLAEFDFRYNERVALGVGDVERTEAARRKGLRSRSYAYVSN